MTTTVGTVNAIMRFPIKSLLGESLEECEIVASGLLGDRGHALVDPSTGKIASAKQPNLWRDLLTFRARTASEMDPRAIVVSDGVGNKVDISDPNFEAKGLRIARKNNQVDQCQADGHRAQSREA